VLPRYLIHGSAAVALVEWGESKMAITKFGYLHCHYGPDMDGSSRTFEWVEARPMDGAPEDEVPGWFAMCEVEPEAGWIGPFGTEAEAVTAATTKKGFLGWMYDQSVLGDPLGDWHGANV
jgi:hypothetical protein